MSAVSAAQATEIAVKALDQIQTRQRARREFVRGPSQKSFAPSIRTICERCAGRGLPGGCPGCGKDGDL